MNEVYLALLGMRVGRYWYGVGHWDAEGSPGGVAFDPDLVLDRDEEKGDVIGFYHTHPGMPADPSSIDYKTMSGWTVCLGKPLVCCIKGVSGLRAHWFIDDETPHITGWIRRFGNLYVGRIPSKVRKAFK
jgi:hypothetical protein